MIYNRVSTISIGDSFDCWQDFFKTSMNLKHRNITKLKKW